LALVRIDWHNSGQARKGVQNGERYGEESIDDRETGWAINSRAILAIIKLKVTVALVPWERGKVARVVTMWCNGCVTEYLKYW
jgi:hypothetical protein